MATKRSEGANITAGMAYHGSSLKATPVASIFQEIGFIDFGSILDKATGSAAPHPRFAQAGGRYCRLFSGHPLGESCLIV